MNDILTDNSKEALVRAIEANKFEYHKAFFGPWPRVEIHQDENMLWCISEMRSPFINGVLWTDLAPEEVDAAIKSMSALYRERKIPLRWMAGALSSPADLAERLRARGFVSRNSSAGMAIDLAELNENVNTSQGLVIERVSDMETLRSWAHVFTAGFGFPPAPQQAWTEQIMIAGLNSQPPIYHYIALLDGVPVATSSLVPGAGVGGIYNVATLDKERRRGIGTAVTLAPLLKAKDMGYRVGVLQASELGFPVYKRMGFAQHCDVGSYTYTKRATQTGNQSE